MRGSLLVVFTLVLLACGSDRADQATPDASLISTTPEQTTSTTETPIEATTSTSAAEPAFGAVAIWWVSPDESVTNESESLTVLVTRADCAGGSTGPISGPEIRYEDTQIVITFSTDPLPTGDDVAYDCPSNDEVPVLLEFDQPIGSRILMDGACLDNSRIADTGLCMPPCRWPLDELPADFHYDEDCQ